MRVLLPALLLWSTAALAAPPADVAGGPLVGPIAAGTLPHPLRSLCLAKDPGCEAVPVAVGAAPGCWAPDLSTASHRACTGGQQCCAGRWLRQGGCGACARTTTRPRHQPRFVGRVRALSQAERSAMTGVTWRPGCPVSLDALRVIEADHWRPDGAIARGRLVVAATVAEPVRDALARLFRARFPLVSLRPMTEYAGSDDRSMAVDNTSAFNCRKMTGSTRWSEHAFGKAIDLNPLRNPYVRGSLVLPPAGRRWLDRKRVRPGMLVPGGPGVLAFTRLGWGWGGTWKRYQDHQHVSESGR